MVLWENGQMKTTMDLPDELMRSIKLRAAHSNRKLREVFVELLQRGLATQGPATAARLVPAPFRFRTGQTMTVEEIDDAIETGRD
jgi:plasmid stability protein